MCLNVYHPSDAPAVIATDRSLSSDPTCIFVQAKPQWHIIRRAADLDPIRCRTAESARDPSAAEGYGPRDAIGNREARVAGTDREITVNGAFTGPPSTSGHRMDRTPRRLRPSRPP